MLRMGNRDINIKLKQFTVRVRRIQKIIRIFNIDLKVINMNII